MGKSDLIKDFRSEAELADFAGITAQRWRADRRYPLLVGLRGELGSGKTTWARATAARAWVTPDACHRRPIRCSSTTPSERCRSSTWICIGCAAKTSLRISGCETGSQKSAPGSLVEWPERAPKLAERCDLILDFRFIGPSARSVTFTAATQAGRDAVHSTS